MQVPIDVGHAPEAPRAAVRRHGGRQGELLRPLRVDEEGNVPLRVGGWVQGLRPALPLPGESPGDSRAAPDAAGPHGPVVNAVALGAVAALAPPGSGVVARNTVGDRAVGQGAPSSCPRGDELGRAPPEVRVRWVGPPSFQPHSTAPCFYLPTLETVSCPREQQTLGAPCALPRGEGNRGDEVVSPGARNTVGAPAVGRCVLQLPWGRRVWACSPGRPSSVVGTT